MAAIAAAARCPPFRWDMTCTRHSLLDPHNSQLYLTPFSIACALRQPFSRHPSSLRSIRGPTFQRLLPGIAATAGALFLSLLPPLDLPWLLSLLLPLRRVACCW
jgi:hypothetical protein